MAHPRILALGLMLGIAGAASAESLLKAADKADALLPVDQAFMLDGAKLKKGELKLDWTIAPGYYLYGHTLKVTVDAPAGTTLPAAKLSKGEKKQDAEFGEVEVHHTSMQAKYALAADARPRTLRVRYQGCADIGVCYPPQTRLVAVK